MHVLACLKQPKKYLNYDDDSQYLLNNENVGCFMQNDKVKCSLDEPHNHIHSCDIFYPKDRPSIQDHDLSRCNASTVAEKRIYLIMMF